MGKASRQKRERNQRGILVDEAVDIQIAQGMLDLIKASSVIRDEKVRKERERTIELSFIKRFSCDCRPPCGAPMQIQSMFDPHQMLSFIPCRKRGGR